jgi:hypothetical protein
MAEHFASFSQQSIFFGDESQKNSRLVPHMCTPRTQQTTNKASLPPTAENTVVTLAILSTNLCRQLRHAWQEGPASARAKHSLCWNTTHARSIDLGVTEAQGEAQSIQYPVINCCQGKEPSLPPAAHVPMSLWNCRAGAPQCPCPVVCAQAFV